jgi:hypothetical protein
MFNLKKNAANVNKNLPRSTEETGIQALAQRMKFGGLLQNFTPPPELA